MNDERKRACLKNELSKALVSWEVLGFRVPASAYFIESLKTFTETRPLVALSLRSMVLASRGRMTGPEMDLRMATVGLPKACARSALTRGKVLRVGRVIGLLLTGMQKKGKQDNKSLAL